MFRIVSITGFGVLLAGIVLHFICSAPKFNDLFGSERKYRALDCLRCLIYPLTLIFFDQKLKFFEIVRKLVYLVTLVCFVILAATGFYQPLVSAKHIGGFAMMIHATVAPVFAICIAILAVMWAGNCSFDVKKCRWLAKLLQIQPADNNSCQKYGFLSKLCFWTVTVLALPLILSIVLSMFRVFGTDIQNIFLEIHRYTALIVAMVIILHTYLSMRNRQE